MVYKQSIHSLSALKLFNFRGYFLKTLKNIWFPLPHAPTQNHNPINQEKNILLKTAMDQIIKPEKCNAYYQ